MHPLVLLFLASKLQKIRAVAPAIAPSGKRVVRTVPPAQVRRVVKR